MSEYTPEFYERRHEETLHSARTVLSVLLDALPPTHSAVDLGCGVGTWLSVVRQRGIRDIRGVEGEWLDRQHLVIPQECFTSADLSMPLQIDRRFDLAISLEVAEHLPPETAGRFVETLAGLSDFVLFSAAIPHQGGVGHVNEQWPGYWSALFERQGFVAFDFIRSRIWHDDDIPAWYRQNLLLFVKAERADEVRPPAPTGETAGRPPAIVHPWFYEGKAAHIETLEARWAKARTVRGSLKLLRKSMARWVGSRFQRKN